MPLARDLHPEFGYRGSGPGLWRKVGLVVVFVVFGLFAGISGVTMFVETPEPAATPANPMQAMALAPAEALLPAAPAEDQSGVSPSPRKSGKAARIKPPPCRENAMENPGADCTPAKAPKPAPAANDRPAIAAIAIGHREEPASLPSLPAAVPPMPDNPPVTSKAVETTPAKRAVVAPPPSASRKARPLRNRQVQRREHNTVSRTWTYHQYGGYARVW